MLLAWKFVTLQQLRGAAFHGQWRNWFACCSLFRCFKGVYRVEPSFPYALDLQAPFMGKA